MKTLPLSLSFLLLITPLHAKSSGNDTNYLMIAAIGATFGCIYIYEWYTQLPAPDENTAKKESTKPAHDLKNIPAKTSVRSSPVQTIELYQKQEEPKQTNTSLTSVIPVQEIPLPTEPALPPQPPLQPLVIPVFIPQPEKSAVTPKTETTSAVSKKATSKYNKTALEVNDSIHGKY